MVIFLKGASSSGKTTLSKALQESLANVYFHVSVGTYLSQIAKIDFNNSTLIEK